MKKIAARTKMTRMKKRRLQPNSQRKGKVLGMMRSDLRKEEEINSRDMLKEVTVMDMVIAAVAVIVVEEVIAAVVVDLAVIEEAEVEEVIVVVAADSVEAEVIVAVVVDLVVIEEA